MDKKSYTCPECNCIMKTKGILKRHLWTIHDVGSQKIYECPEDDCVYKSKRKDHLKIHLWVIHNLGQGKIYNCPEDNCVYNTKDKSSLNTHLWNIHNVGNRKIHKCTNCDYNTKCKGSLKTHLWRIHNTGDGKVYKCPKDNCDYNTKSKGHLKRHLSLIHDIGDLKCEYCFRMVNTCIPYPDKNLKKSVSICRKCYKKATGYNTFKEKRMVESISAHSQLGPYIVSHNRQIKGEQCKSTDRPDLVLASTEDLYLIIECDEHAHTGYFRSCELSRMDRLIDEVSQGQVIIIRWNPDKTRDDTFKLKSLSFNDRLEILQDFLVYLQSLPCKQITHGFLVVYMFYGPFHPMLSDRHPLLHVNSREDFSNLDLFIKDSGVEISETLSRISDKRSGGNSSRKQKTLSEIWNPSKKVKR